MNFLTWGRNPWGQQVLTHVSWDLLWASLFAGLMFLVAHGSYMILSYRKRSSSETDALEAANKDLPTMITRHSFMARVFHWVQAAAMFTLLFTAFLPIVGVKFHHPRVLLPGFLVHLGGPEGHSRTARRAASRARP
ncbi:MAG: hypothetical protein DMF89_22585 [Acidobacteria bacterium]|nr:MAG: hypothetical protein DMF89_22585 [Acidobacteriota bacterium]